MLHLEGEEVFKSCKWSANLPFGLEKDSTNLNFCCRQIDKTSIDINTQACDNGPLPIVGANCGIFVFTHIDGDNCESPCGHGVYCIKHCPPKSNIQCNALQKDISHESCKVKIIS